MKKLFLILSILFLASTTSSYADEYIFPNGEVVKGKIDYILDGFIGIKTKAGFRKISREVPVGYARDVATIGYFKTEKLTGQIYLLNTDYLEIETSTGSVRIPRRKVKDVIIAQENF